MTQEEKKEITPELRETMIAAAFGIIYRLEGDGVIFELFNETNKIIMEDLYHRFPDRVPELFDKYRIRHEEQITRFFQALENMIRDRVNAKNEPGGVDK